MFQKSLRLNEMWCTILCCFAHFAFHCAYQHIPQLSLYHYIKPESISSTFERMFFKYAPRCAITVAAHEPTYSSPHIIYVTSTLVLSSLSEIITVRSIEIPV
jgi:hypothetical protein